MALLLQHVGAVVDLLSDSALTAGYVALVMVLKNACLLYMAAQRASFTMMLLRSLLEKQLVCAAR